MLLSELSGFDWFVLARHELILFAATFFLIGALDEFALDFIYVWFRGTGRISTPRVDDTELAGRPLAGRSAVFLPAWQEHQVIGTTVRHMLEVWPQRELRLYVGCYRDDVQTVEAALAAIAGDERAKVIVHDVSGPTCKADCLNRLYDALVADENRDNVPTRMVVVHDAEDMVDRAALPLLDAALATADFVQLPVLALPQASSPLVGGHYSDEFAESHAKAMVVRSALGHGIPGAGVGCAIARDWLRRIDSARGSTGPFAAGALTEDYELGLQSARLGARGVFLRVRTNDGRLVATRAYFPTSMRTAIRQKARWINGIALQGWDRLGWGGPPMAVWMQLRDRRGPLAALLLALAYVLVIASAVELILSHAGAMVMPPLSPALQLVLWLNVVALAWRLGARMAFTTREFGFVQGFLAVPRVVVSNTVAIVAARRAIFAYIASLGGARTSWDKTEHTAHPALAAASSAKATN